MSLAGMDFMFSRDPDIVHLLHHLCGEEEEPPTSEPVPAKKAYLRDRNAMAGTAVDVKESPDAYLFIADMPGVKSSDVKATVENGNVLVLSGERKKEKEKDVKYLSIERRLTKFMRKFTLPSNADVDKISATFQDGVLTVTVPKIPPPTPKVIEVNVN